MVAMVAEEDDDGIGGGWGIVEGIEDFSELGVHVADIGEVAVSHFGGLCGGWRFLVVGGAEDFGALVEGGGGGIFRSGVQKFREFAAIVKIPVFFRCVEVGVRFPEADGEEEGLVGGIANGAYGCFGDASVVIGGIGHIATFADSGACVTEAGGGLGEVGRKGTIDAGAIVTVIGIVEEFRNAP